MPRVLKSIAMLLVLSGVLCADSRLDFRSDKSLGPGFSLSNAGTGLSRPYTPMDFSRGSLLAAAQHSSADTRPASEEGAFSLAVPEPGTLGLLGTGLLGLAGLLRRKRRL